MLTRERYREDLERAYEIQSRAGVEVCFLKYRKGVLTETNGSPLQGALRGTAIGFGSAILAHYTWPLFRYIVVGLIVSLHDLTCIGGTGDRHWLSRVFWYPGVSTQIDYQHWPGLTICSTTKTSRRIWSCVQRRKGVDGA